MRSIITKQNAAGIVTTHVAVPCVAIWPEKVGLGVPVFVDSVEEYLNDCAEYGDTIVKVEEVP